VQYLKQALVEIASPASHDAISENRRVHDILVDEYRLGYVDADGQEVDTTIRAGTRQEHNDRRARPHVASAPARPGADAPDGRGHWKLATAASAAAPSSTAA